MLCSFPSHDAARLPRFAAAAAAAWPAEAAHAACIGTHSSAGTHAYELIQTRVRAATLFLGVVVVCFLQCLLFCWAMPCHAMPLHTMSLLSCLHYIHAIA